MLCCRNFNNLGWEKCRIPDSFVDFMENLVLKRSSGPRSPSAKGGWKKVMQDHLHNERTARANFLGKDCRTQYDWIYQRYLGKKEFYEMHFVSSQADS